MLVWPLVLFSEGLNISGFYLPLKLLLYKDFSIESRESLPIFLQGLFLRGHSIQSHKPGFICNFKVGVWIIICLQEKFEHIRKFLLYDLCRDVIQFPEPDCGGLLGAWCLGMPKRISLWSDTRSKTIGLSRTAEEASLVITWSNRLLLW